MTYFGESLGVELYIRFYEQFMDECGVPPALRERINNGNLLALFGLD